MKLNNVYRVGDSQAGNIGISEGKITDAAHEPSSAMQLMFDKALVFPGLINSHDHLDFNLFPQLGDRIYANYTEWGAYIHQNYQQQIAEVMRVPLDLRTEWGNYKNLLAGVTTVINHGDKLPVKDSLITVYEKGQSLHSLGFEKRWKTMLNHPFRKNIPVVIHTGEGTDKAAAAEIDRLISWNLFNRDLIGIHGVAMSPPQARNFKALVWCPQSNYFLLGDTAAINVLKRHTAILFGTDSTLTSGWNIWEHIRQARETGLLTDAELLDSLTTAPASAWGLSTGTIAPGYDADLVVARIKEEAPSSDSFFKLNPADILLVLHKGNIRLFDASLYSQLNEVPKNNFSKINIDGAYKYVYGNLPGLMNEIKAYYSGARFPVNELVTN